LEDLIIEGTIILNVKETSVGVNWTHLILDRYQWSGLLNTVMFLSVP
jgi:hypothetical protein